RLAGRQVRRLAVVSARGLGKRLVQSTVRPQAVRVETVGIGKGGIQLDGPPKFALRRWPVPVVKAQLIAERRVGLGERGLERERLEGSGSRFRHAFGRTELGPTRQCK